MKKTWTCPKCASARIGYFEQLHDESDTAKPTDRVIGTAMVGEFLGMKAARRIGAIEAFVCADCGYFEEYLKDPANMPWDKMLHFRWCRP